MSVNYHILGSTIVINYNSTITKINKNTKLAEKVLELIKSNRLEEIPDLVSYEKRISKQSKEKFYLEDGQVYSFGERVHDIISTKIVQFLEEGLPVDMLINFWNNVKLNPSKDSVNELYTFLEVNEFPLTADGYFIAYKRVTKGFKDIWTNTIDNSPGAKPSMKRDDVCSDRNITCAPGLHIASYHYAKYDYYGGDPNTVLLEVKVNPKDVVSIPTDYDFAKCRTCGYEVIGKVDVEHEATFLEDEKYVPKEKKKSEIDKTKLTSCTLTELNIPDVAAEIENDTFIKENVIYDQSVKIGNFYYKAVGIVDTLENVLSEVKNFGYKRRKPSDFPVVLKRFLGGSTLEDVYAIKQFDGSFTYICIYQHGNYIKFV